MERINRLYSELQNVQELKSKREQKLNKIKKNEHELYELIQMQNSLNCKKQSLPELQKQLKEVENEIKNLSLRNKKINDYKEILEIQDDELFKVKSFEYINNLVYDWTENEEQTIVLNKNTIKFFRHMKSKSYYKELKNNYYEKLSKYFKGILFEDLSFEETQGEFYFNIIKDSKKENRIKIFYDDNKELCNFLFAIICENVDKKICELIKQRKTGYSDVLSRNNKIIKETKHAINDETAHIESIVLNIIDNVCTSPRNDIKIDLDLRGYSFSEEFTTLLFCFDILKDKTRITSLKSLIAEFFCLDKIDCDIFNCVCIFAEIDYLIKKYEFRNLSTQKELIFCHIIKISGINEINLRNEIDTIRSDVYQNQYAFKDIIELFLQDNLKLTFIISYFDSLCDHILKYILSRQSISIKESECFSELITFVNELSGIERMLNNNCRMNCVETVLRSGLKEIDEYYSSGKLCLDANEMVKLICALFTDTARRSEILEKITN